MTKKLFLRLSLLVIVCSIIIGTITIFLVIRTQTSPHIYNNVESLPHTETALILGASVFEDGTLSSVLKDRANAAIIIYKAHKVEKIIVSGDNSTTTYNEVNPVKNYLVEHGISPDVVFLDYAGFDTYSSIYRARDIFLVASTTIVSQSFHLPRAVFIAQHLGVTAYGFNADDGHYLLSNYIRELLANIKAVWNLTTRTKPKYLGKIVPVQGEEQTP